MGLFIDEGGKLDFKGEVFAIHSEFQYLSKEKKLEMLIMLLNWVNDTITALEEED